jgi:hypothetical protein
MGIVSNALRDLVARQVDANGLVVWYDPERHYETFVHRLALPGARIARYEGSFFALRHAVEPLLAGSEKPRLVVYVPLDPLRTDRALAELESAGVVLRPGQQPPARNTKLSLLARNALKDVVGPETAAALEKQVESPGLSLDELDRLGERGAGLKQAVLPLIFHTDNPTDIALAFLHDDRHDADLLKRRAWSSLAVLLEVSDAGAAASEDWTAEDFQRLRNRLARDVLLADLADSGVSLPEPLAARVAPPSPLVASLGRAWRVRSDRRDSYAAHAERVEKELNLAALAQRHPSLATPQAETFLALERALLRQTAADLLREATEERIGLAQARQSSFWACLRPEVQTHWALLATAGQLLAEADRIARELKSAPTDAAALFRAYTEGERPWCLLDTHQRHLERRCHAFDFDLGGGHAELERLIARARQRHAEVGADLAERFVRLYQRGKFRLAGIPRQAETFSRCVRPRLAEGKTAYVWVDALRFEMARELAALLANEFAVALEATTATAPTITSVGMAALLPGAEEGACLVATGGQLALQVSGETIKDRKDRVAFLKERVGVAVCEAKLEDLLPSPKKRVREAIASAGLVLVTSQEIDALCEGDNVPLARRAMEGMLHELRRAFRLLAELGVTSLVVAADHGYLFGEELGDDMKLDDPGGETAALHRRVWVGRGGTSEPSYLRARLADLGLGSDLDLAVPWGFACFRVRGGASAYFHGGLSPQEVAVPVLVLTAAARRPAPGGEVSWSLTPGSRKLTTRFFSVQVSGQVAGMFEPALPKLRVEIRAKGGTVSVPVSASYGFEEATGDFQMRLAESDPRVCEPNTVTLMLAEAPEQKTVTVLLLDAVSGVELTRLDRVEVDIAI